MIKSDRKIFIAIFIITAFVLSLIILLKGREQSEHLPEYIAALPLFNAILNGSCFIILIGTFIAIKNKKTDLHKRLNLTAFFFSSIFLISYVIFHSYGIETRFPTENPWRPIYLFILLTHIALAAIVLPLILISLYFGMTNKVEKHKKIVRFSYPIWLYVTLSGVLVYIMIEPYYRF